MKDVNIQTKAGVFTYHLPTSIQEITPEYLKEITKHIVIADYYTLIGIIYHEKLNRIVLAQKTKKKGIDTGVIPIFVAAGEIHASYLDKAETGDKILITGTQVGLGTHVAVTPNQLNLNAFLNKLSTTTDPELYDTLIQDDDNREVMFIEFKMVPNSDIQGIYKTPHTKLEMPYVEQTIKA